MKKNSKRYIDFDKAAVFLCLDWYPYPLVTLRQCAMLTPYWIGISTKRLATLLAQGVL